MIQGTDEWKESRLGMVTASRVADIMAKTRSGESATRKNYMMELLCQRLTGVYSEGFASGAMQRGTELETVARSMFEIQTGLTVEETGSIRHPTIEMFSASPDGLIGNDGLIEIKCPNTAQHISFLVENEIPTKYQWQMRAQMACTDREWCIYCQYDDRVPENMQLLYKKFYRSVEEEGLMLQEINNFLQDLERLEIKISEAFQGFQ